MPSHHTARSAVASVNERLKQHAQSTALQLAGAGGLQGPAARTVLSLTLESGVGARAAGRRLMATTHSLRIVTVLTLGSALGLNPVVGFACTSSGMPVDRPAHARATLCLRMRAADAHRTVCGAAQVWMMEWSLCPKRTAGVVV